MKILNLTNLLSSSNFFRTAILFCAFLIAMTGTQAQAQTLNWTSVGPGGGIPTALAVAPSAPNTIYVAGANAGVLKSTDGGASWTKSATGLSVVVNGNLNIAKITSLAVDLTNPNVVYAGNENSNLPTVVFKSTDGGATWVSSSLGITTSMVYTLAIDPSNSQIIYAGTSVGVYRSTNGGATWNLRSNGMGGGAFPTISDMTVFPGDANIIFAITRSGGYKTVDGGANWTLKFSGDFFGGKVAFHPTNSNIIYRAGNGLLARSTNGGDSFINVTVGSFQGDSSDVIFDKANPATIYASYRAFGSFVGAAIYKSTDNGTTWTLINTGLSSYQINQGLLDVGTSEGSVFLATTSVSGGDVYKTVNGGTSWQTLSSNNGYSASDVIAVVAAPTNPSILYALTASGISKSTNRGVSWAKINPPLNAFSPGSVSQLLSIAVSPTNANTIYVGSRFSQLFRSTNDGASWTRLNQGMNNEMGATNIAIAPSNAEMMFVSASGSGALLFRTTDAGGSWQSFTTPCGNTGTFTVDRTNADKVWHVNGGLCRSINGGITWTAVPVGALSIIDGISISPTNADLMYATGRFSIGCDEFSAYTLGVYRSTDGGTTWTKTNTVGTARNRSFAPGFIDPNNSNTLYTIGVIGTSQCTRLDPNVVEGLLRSTDGGATWQFFAKAGQELPNVLLRSSYIDFAAGFFAIGTFGSGLWTATTTPVVVPRTRFDFDGDGKADVSVFRPSNSVWYLLNSQSGFTAAQFGVSTDKITSADFDGDGRTDIAVFRDGVWYWLNSSNGTFNSFQFGIAGDIPIPADFTGDGRAELAVYRAGVWYIWNLATSQFNAVQFGIASDKVVPADFDGDGKTDIAVYRDGVWYWLRSSDNGFRAVQFGIASDKPTVGDYDGDGKADPAVYRSGVWYVLGSTQGFYATQFGIATDIPTAADYDGDGKTDIAVYRTGNGTWYWLRSLDNEFRAVQFGIAEDKPIPATFVP